MRSTRTLPPLRILLAMALTAVAVLALVVNAALTAGDDGAADAPAEPATTTAVDPPPPPPEVVETSVVVAPDWYPKGSSRYADRETTMTITTLTPTTAPLPGDDGG